MKTQALGWLAAAVVAAGVNASYHQGGLEWAHRIADQVGHNTEAVMALATGRADRFLEEAQVVKAQDQVASCRFATAMARVQSRIARSEAGFEGFEAISAREEAQLARLEANRARIEARVARIHIPAVAVTPVVVRVPKVDVCPRVHVNLPQIRVPEVPTVHIDVPGAGTI